MSISLTIGILSQMPAKRIKCYSQHERYAVGNKTRTRARRPYLRFTHSARKTEYQAASERASERAMIKSAVHPLLASLPPTYYSIPLKNPPSRSFNRFFCHSSSSSSSSSKNNNVKKSVQEPYFPPRFSVAPMMDWTDNHYRTLARLISKHAWLYTEMVVAETIVHKQDNLDRFLSFPREQHPIALQIGGSNLNNLSKAAALANSYNYDAINLNCGCPSGKVAGHGCFGARLMLNPKFVAEAMSAIAENCDAPVSVKCRIGVDDHDSYSELSEKLAVLRMYCLELLVLYQAFGTRVRGILELDDYLSFEA
ncbi:hypothetical protein Syun_001473 [Stephania yunnanensis]|uniref:DUS-like FMN-binding domain-containing protein n=1 Tax=Stephania yunnanensis TaxID=152371 RepID=A0AAP0LDX6_9MAGN